MPPLDLRPDWRASPTPFARTWTPLCNIDQFRWFSRADMLRQLALARDELDIRHVRPTATYSPEMAVWDYDPIQLNGSPTLIAASRPAPPAA